MTRRKDFTSALTYTGQKLKNVTIGRKIDGVRLLRRDGKIVTRNNKIPMGLYIALTSEALDKIRKYKDCEVYKGSFHETNGPMSRLSPEPNSITEDHIYPLDFQNGKMDKRLMLGFYKEPTKDQILKLMEKQVALGYEGLVLRSNGRWYRVKPKKTADVFITGFFEQKDKNKNPKGILGGFETMYGKVTAFTNEMRKQLWINPEQYIGKLIEVEYKELYDTGKFRYAVKFIRFRTDKSIESFDTKNI